MNPTVHSDTLVYILVIAALFGFGKNIVEGVIRLQNYAKTKDGQATLLVACLAMCLVTLIVVLLRF